MHFPARPLWTWYLKHRRKMPWRETASPYRTWISEIMLQQTQVQSVIDHFNRFVKRFPDASALARAQEAEVFRHWAGLGYYSRARNLHKAAKMIAAEHGGNVPNDPASVLRLPGVGPYTAGAILSIAFNRPEPILDGNVRRVLSRLFLETSTEKLWDLSRAAVTRAHGRGIPPSEFNQALMELGALVCSPRDPDCGICPVRKSCLAEKKGLQSEYPPAAVKPETLRQDLALLVLESGGRFLMQKRSKGQAWLKNFWCFPMLEVRGVRAGDLSRKFKALIGMPVSVGDRLGTIRHSITRHAIRADAYAGRTRASCPRPASGFRWMTLPELKAVSWSSLNRKVLDLLR